MPRDLQSAIPWDEVYSMQTHDLIEDFYEPVLSNTIRYDRTAGYFYSSVLAANSVGFEQFCDNPGSKMRMIVGLQMSPEDHERYEYWSAPEKVSETIRKIVEEELSSAEMPDFVKSKLAGLSWMLDNEKLDIKFGVMLHPVSLQPVPWEWAKLHHKIAYFEDDQATPNAAVIYGSVNETATAWKFNGDSFTPHLSWEGGRSSRTVNKSRDLFEAMWETEGKNDEYKVAIYSFPELKDTWKRIVSPVHPKDTLQWNGRRGKEDSVTVDETDDDPKWVHQNEAIELFLEERDDTLNSHPMPAGKRGILCMATGTGKTRTALKIVKKMFEDGDISKLIITTHKSDLLDQWYEELNNPNRGLNKHIGAIFRHYSTSKGAHRQSGDYPFSSVDGKCLLAGRKPFHDLLKHAREGELEDTLLIVDECHNFRGSEARKNMQGLYKQIPFRLGLSATPENEYDADATQFLYDEIGPIYFNFDLLNAIENGILCPFEYHPIEYTPSQQDRDKIKSIKARYEQEIAENPNKRLQLEIDMRRDMARVYKKSLEKLPPLSELINSNTILKRCIIFGPEKPFNENIEEMLNRKIPPIPWTTYYGETNSEQLDLYRQGNIEVLLTCKAIAEGIDLDVDNIILVSSDRTRLENIQRIGRALRTHGDMGKIAKVYDFIRNDAPSSSDTYREAWLSELSALGIASRNKEQ